MPSMDQRALRRVRVATQFPARARTFVDLHRHTGLHRAHRGVDVYLALRARARGLQPEALHLAVAQGELTVGPSVRGCLHLGLSEDRAVMLGAASHLGRARWLRELARVPVPAVEIESVARAVLTTLERDGPTSTDELRRALPPGTLRPLGDAGRRLGLATPLPHVLRLLECDGCIARRPRDGRLDHELFAWSLAAPIGRIPVGALARELATRFFAWAGLATLEAFIAWSGLAPNDAAPAVDAVGLNRYDIDGIAYLGDPVIVRTGWRRDLESFVALLPFDDNLLSFGQGLADWIDPRHHARRLPLAAEAASPPLGEARHAALRPVLARDRLIGFWEFDPTRRDIEVGYLDPPDTATRDAVTAEAQATARYLREHFAHARSSSIDTEAEMARRVAAVRALS